jgi:hypothetical protein
VRPALDAWTGRRDNQAEGFAMRSLAVCALLLCWGLPRTAAGQAPAVAAPAAPSPTVAAGQPSQPQTDAASPLLARARALIAGSGAGEFFEPADASPTLVSVRHRPSGLLCALDPNARLRLIIYPPTASGAAHGDDVSCTSLAASGALALYATRYPTDMSLDEAFARALREFSDVHPNAESYTPQVQIDLSDRPSLPRSRTAAFLLRGPAGMNFSGLWVAKVNGWIVKMRFTGPQGMASELSSSVSWSTALSSVAHAGAGR